MQQVLAPVAYSNEAGDPQVNEDSTWDSAIDLLLRLNNDPGVAGSNTYLRGYWDMLRHSDGSLRWFITH